MKDNIAIVAGATGLIGNILVRNLVKDDTFTKVITLGRRKTKHAAAILEHHIVDFDQLSEFKDIEKATIAFCSLGTTMKKAGSKAAFYKVDYTYIVAFAKYAFSLGCQQFYLVSSMGADKDSFFYYNQVKGEVEEAVQKIGFKRVHLMRPSLLLGDRKEQRIGEKIGQVMSQAFSFLIPDNYKGIQATSVANYMQHLSTTTIDNGVHIHESGEIRRYTT